MSNFEALIKQNYGSLYKTTGGGHRQVGGASINDMVKKILGSRILDVYLKYLGLKTLNTITMVPIAIIMGKQYFERYLKNKGQIGGGSLDIKVPFLDHPLVGELLKLTGLTVMGVSPNTLVPLGIAIIAYDLLDKKVVNGELVGGAKKNSRRQLGGSRTILSSDVPENIFQKVDNWWRGISGTTNIGNLPERFPEYNKIAHGCSAGESCKPSNLGPYSNQYTNKVNGFDRLGIPSGIATTVMSGEHAPVNFDLPRSMAGGSRKIQKGRGSQWMASQYSRGPINNATMSEQMLKNFTNDTPVSSLGDVPVSSELLVNRNLRDLGNTDGIVGLPYNGVGTKSFKGGALTKSKIQNIYSKIMEGGARTDIVNDLIHTWRKVDQGTIELEKAKAIRKASRDNRIANLTILKQFPKEVLDQHYKSL